MTFYSDKPEHKEQLAQALATEPKADILSQRRSLKKLLRLSPVPLYVETAADYRGNRYYVMTTTEERGLRRLSPETIAYLTDKEDREME